MKETIPLNTQQFSPKYASRLFPVPPAPLTALFIQDYFTIRVVLLKVSPNGRIPYTPDDLLPLGNLGVSEVRLSRRWLVQVFPYSQRKTCQAYTYSWDVLDFKHFREQGEPRSVRSSGLGLVPTASFLVHTEAPITHTVRDLREPRLDTRRVQGTMNLAHAEPVQPLTLPRCRAAMLFA